MAPVRAAASVWRASFHGAARSGRTRSPSWRGATRLPRDGMPPLSCGSIGLCHAEPGAGAAIVAAAVPAVHEQQDRLGDRPGPREQQVQEPGLAAEHHLRARPHGDLDERAGHRLGRVGVRRDAREPARAARRAGEQRRVDRAGVDHRDAHAGALLALLDAQRVEEPAQGVLGGGVRRPRRQRHARHQGPGRHDDAAAGPQVRQRRADDVHGARERDRDRAVEVVGMHLADVAEDRRGGVGHDDVEPAERGDRRGHRLLRLAAVAEVGRDRHGIDPLGPQQLAERGAAPRDDGEARALGGQHPGGGQPDAGAGSRDEHAAALQAPGGGGGERHRGPTGGAARGISPGAAAGRASRAAGRPRAAPSGARSRR